MASNAKDRSGLWIPIAIEVVLSLLGFWTLWAFPYNNGLLKILKNQTEAGALIPGPTAAPMKQTYTGIPPVDNQLTVLVSFFYTAIDGNRGDVSLSFLGLGGGVLAAWTLITVESFRSGNKSNVLIKSYVTLLSALPYMLTIYSTTIFGLAVAIIGYACVAPLWFAYHLAFSSTVVNPDPFELSIESPLKTTLAPLAIMIGFGLPSVIMTLPAPAILSFETKQLWTGIQQGWPLWIALAQLGLTFAVSFFDPSSSVYSEEQKKTKATRSLRLAYIFGLLCSAGAHLTVWSMCLLAYAFPVLFAAPYNKQLLPANVLAPINPFAPLQAQTLADGALWFLQWDTIVGVVSTAIWGLALRTTAKHESASIGQWISGLIKVTIIALAVGPCGAAVVAIWGRDELVNKRAAEEEKAVSKPRKTK